VYCYMTCLTCLFVVFSAICAITNTTARSSIRLLTSFSVLLVPPHVATVGCVQLLFTLRHDVCTLCTLLPKVCPMFHDERLILKQSSICRRIRLVLSETIHTRARARTHARTHLHKTHTYFHTNIHTRVLTHTFTHTHTLIHSHKYTHSHTNTHTSAHFHTHSHKHIHTFTHTHTST